MDPLGALSMSGTTQSETHEAPGLQRELRGSGGGDAAGPLPLPQDERGHVLPSQPQKQVREQQHPTQQQSQGAQQQQQQQQQQREAAPRQPLAAAPNSASSFLAAATAAASAAASAASAAASKASAAAAAKASAVAAAAAAQLPLLPAVAVPRAAAAAPAAAQTSAASLSSPQGGSPAAASSLAQPEAPRQPLSPSSRTQRFRRVLASEPAINMAELRALAFEGIPDEPQARGLRAAVYRLVLGLLPPERAQWERALRRKRAEYGQFCEELIVDPKNLSTPAGVEAAPGSHPNPLVSQGSGASSSSAASTPATAAALECGDGGSGKVDGEEGSGAAGTAAAAAVAEGLPGSSEGNGSNSGTPTAAAAAAAAHLQRLALSSDDHPLSNSSSSKWKAYFQDVEVQEQIERDVARTHPDMHFFSGEGGAAPLHRAQLRRALFVFAKLNPGLRYVQGMNELYAPLYYLFRTDPDAEAAQHAEADAFFCFVDLMGEFRDHFCQQLDNSSVGIRATLGRLSSLLRCHDEELWQHLERVRINPQFYAFRWITLALTQEFSFPDALRLWDTLLSDPAGRTDCLLRLCTAMLMNVRQELLQGDFASCMKLLQRYPSVDVHVILDRAEALKHTKTVIVLD